MYHTIGIQYRYQYCTREEHASETRVTFSFSLSAGAFREYRINTNTRTLFCDEYDNVLPPAQKTGTLN